MSLERIRIVLCRPTHPGNIGSAARAMKTMGLSQLALVDPLRFPHAEATALAADAADLLDRAVVTSTLERAIDDCGIVIGTSARDRRIGWPTLTPQEAAERLLDAAKAGNVALLFGQERTGLTNDELDRCQYVVTIPTSVAYTSLNLASAVQILAYELFRVRNAGVLPEPAAPEQPFATAGEMERFYEHLEEVLVQIGFLNPDKPRLLMRRLARLFGRVQMDRNELNIIRGILTAVQHDRGRHG